LASGNFYPFIVGRQMKLLSAPIVMALRLPFVVGGLSSVVFFGVSFL
jgi:hypothetical protein